MEKTKSILYDIINGGAGGAFIAAGCVSAIDYMERGPSFVILFAVMGIIGCIIIEHAVSSRAAVLAAMGAFLCGMLLKSDVIKYVASGFIIYAGCALALPEKDVFTDAATAAAAAGGFMIVLAAML